jgi:ActR/RegA family two-component response regulator
MTTQRILVVDDDDDVREVYQMGLQNRGFEVVSASTVNEALRLISTEHFDVLLSDLRMPDPGDGFTVVSAMRHAHPQALTLLLSGYPAVHEAMSAILLEADQVLAKPVGIEAIAEFIQEKTANPTARAATKKESVATILEHDLEPTIHHWMNKVKEDDELRGIKLSYQDRTGHLPKLLRDLILRMRIAPNAEIPLSSAARDHGILRHDQGYTVAMVVEESRILQVSIFNTLQKNLQKVDFSKVLLDVMTIADEVDSQLKQAMLGYMSVGAQSPQMTEPHAEVATKEPSNPKQLTYDHLPKSPQASLIRESSIDDGSSY